MQVHIDRGGQRFGPYSVEQVNSHLTDGIILPTDLGWTDGMADWVPVTQIPGVTSGVTSGATTTAAPAPPPTPEPAAPAGGSACPSCNAAVTAEQVICMGCGANLQGGAAATQAVAKPAGNKKLLIGVGAGVGVLALAAVGYFVVYPKLTADDANQETGDLSAEEQSPSGEGGPGMGQRPGGGFAGGKGGPKGGFGGQGGGQGRPKGKGGGFDPMRYDRNKDGKISRNEVPQQMSRFFDMVDKNKDGFLDQNEMKSFGAGFGGFGGKGRPPSGGGQQQPGGFGGKGRPQGGGQQRPPKGGGQQQPPQGGPQGRPQPRPIQ